MKHRCLLHWINFPTRCFCKFKVVLIYNYKPFNLNIIFIGITFALMKTRCNILSNTILSSNRRTFLSFMIVIYRAREPLWQNIARVVRRYRYERFFFFFFFFFFLRLVIMALLKKSFLKQRIYWLRKNIFLRKCMSLTFKNYHWYALHTIAEHGMRFIPLQKP